MVDIGVTTPWRRTPVFPEYRDRSVLEVFQKLAATCGERTAVRDGERSLSYRALHQSILAIAGAVGDARPPGHGGVGDQPWVITGVVGHGIDAVLTVYGVLAAGAVLVPIDAAEPVERMAVIHREGSAQLAISSATHADRARAATGGPVLLLDDLTRRAGSPDHPGPEPGTPAMVNFTSGSTGTPKGVVRDHDALVRAGFTTAQSNLIEADDVVAFTGSFSFIGAYARSLGAFVAGAELCIHDQRIAGGRGLAEWILDRRVSVLQFIPSVLRNFTEAASRAGVPRMDSVKIVSLGGETTYGRDVARARELFGPSTRFVTRYGSSETSVLAEWLATPADDARTDEPFPLGRPLPWAEIVVVDEAGEPVAPGEVGVPAAVSEHCALGYWNNPELTAAKFWTLPDGRRGFRLSDHVRQRDDGVLEYVARADDRVKVRGVMVSPSEVERAFTALDGVHDAAVVPAPARDGGTRLVGYVVPDAGTSISTWEARRSLAAALPSAMVPGTVVVLESLPLTPHGKIDRRALPPSPDPAPRPYRAPGGREAELAGIFADVLGVDAVGLDDDFFELGGDSLGVVELVAEIADRFAVDVPTSTVLEAPTVAELYLRLSHRRPRHASPIVMLRSDAASPPFFCVTGGGAPAISLRQLCAGLPDRNFAAIQPRGLEERALPDHSIVTAAQRNVAALRAVQPHGPYTIAGYSYGGVVAFEMACRLRAAGEEVAQLVIVDINAPAGTRSLGRRVRRRAHDLNTGAPDSTRWRSAAVAGRAARFAVASAYAHAERRVALTTAGFWPRRGYHQYELFLRLNTRMLREYTPSSTFDGATLVVRGVETDGAPPETETPPTPAQRMLADLGWSKLVTGPVTAVEVPADHLGILRKPAVDLVAGHIAAALADGAGTEG
jgi:acyl-coenzyme A synthetase/AMP-(fatty) acid ligase/thioesterase domain-containing protein/acyl carrier protein